MSSRSFFVASIVSLLWTGAAHADEGASTNEPDAREAPPAAAQEKADARDHAPIVGYAYGVRDSSRRSVGARTYGLALGARGQRAVAGGGATIWASPIDRLTLMVDGARDAFGNLSPSGGAIVRLLGSSEGWSLGALGNGKVEGFGTGPNGETEAEIESGFIVSYAGAGWRLDVDGIGGFGTGDDGEIDAEGRLRVGRDVAGPVRIGVDGQARFRLAGDKALPGGRTWDFAGGPQVAVGGRHLFAALTGGPATMGVLSSNVGWTGVVSVGGSTL